MVLKEVLREPEGASAKKSKSGDSCLLFVLMVRFGTDDEFRRIKLF